MMQNKAYNILEKIMYVVITIVIFLIIGTVGALETDSIGIGQFFLQTIGFFALLLISIGATRYCRIMKALTKYENINDEFDDIIDVFESLARMSHQR